MIISIYNTAASQGKSTTAWFVANELGLRHPGKVALLDLDLVNTNGETIGNYVAHTADMLRPFDVFTVDTWNEDDESYDYVIADCSKSPDKALKDLVKSESSAVLIPAKEDKDLNETVDCMREMFQAGVKTGLVMNGFSLAVASELESSGRAFKADRVTDVPVLDGAYNMVSIGDLPQNKPIKDKQAKRIRAEFSRIVNDIEGWLNVPVIEEAA